MPDIIELDAEKILEAALSTHENILNILIAKTSIWAHPDVHIQLIEKTGNPARFPNTRRARIGSGEKRGQSLETITFDNNTKANNAIKQAIGIPRKKIKGFAVCHIWDGTCYDERYHTVIANLVLLPRALESLTDHYPPAKKILQYRSYDLYKWHPENQNPPSKPDGYDNLPWQEIKKPNITRTQSRTKEVSSSIVQKNIINKIDGWSKKENLNVHKIIALIQKNEGIERKALIRSLQSYGFSSNPEGAIASLMTNSGNSYGHILEITPDKKVYFTNEAAIIIKKLKWSI